MAYDNGTAAMMNNPATLAMMNEGINLDPALGFIAPQVKSSAGGMTSSSSADFFGGPAIGLVRKQNGLLFGVGMYGQGGMGAEYNDSAAYGVLRNFTGAGGAVVADPGWKNRSEVGVGRVIFPLAMEVNDRLIVSGSLDYVWAGMDIQWLMDGAHFGNLLPGQSNRFGSASGSLVTNFQAGFGPAFTDVNYGYFNFSNDNSFTGRASGTGYAGKLGLVYKIDSGLTFGATYHPKTHISDLETDSNMSVGFNVFVPIGSPLVGAGATANANNFIPITGKMTVRDFQWPETYGLGLAWQATDKWMIAADYKRINWSGAMKSFNMHFVANDTQANGMAAGFAGNVMDIDYKQQWKDQHVVMLGVAHRYSDVLTLRMGVSLANNPVPDDYVTPLFPAVVKNHITAGLGYVIGKQSHLDLAFSYAPKVTVTNHWSDVSGGGGATSNQTISMEQFNGQLVYSYHF
jgi:long-chain fatty acid transport protein